MKTFFLIYASAQVLIVLFFGRIYYVRSREELRERRQERERFPTLRGAVVPRIRRK